MSLLEQLAMAWISFGHALRGSARSSVWVPWLLPIGVSLLALVALAWCAHPLLSPVMAPLVRASAGEEALGYPGLYRQLPHITADLRFLLDATLLPVAFGGSALAFAAGFRGEEPAPGDVLRDTLRLAPVFLLASLPVWLAEAGLHAAVAALPGIRLSGPSRALAPHAAIVALVMVRAAWVYAPVHAAIFRRGAFAAVAALPGAFRDGFVPALVTLLVLALPLVVLDSVAAGPFAAFSARVPESVLVLAALRDVLAGIAGVLATGTVTLVWLSAIAPGEAA